MGLGLIAFGIAFFILPCLGMVDIMPDFIGAILIIGGLKKLRDTDSRLESARSLFMRFMFLDLIKNILAFPVRKTDETTVMTVCFIFSIICTILLFSAFSELFEGLYYVFSRANSKACEENFTGVKAISRLFSILYYVFLMIPQLVVLTNPEYTMAEDISKFFSLYDYKNIITLLCLVLSLLLGIVFAYSCISYLLSVKKEKSTLEGLDLIYKNNLADRPGVLICRRFSGSFIFIFAGLLFMTELRFDGVNIVPDLVGFALMAVGAFKLAQDHPAAKKMYITSAVFSVLTIPTFVFNFYVSDNYFRSTAITDKIRTLYLLQSISRATEFVCLGITAFMLFLLIRQIAESITSNDGSDENSFKYRQNIETKKYFFSRAVIILSFGIVLCISSIVMSFFSVKYEALWLISSLGAILFAIYTGKTLSALYDNVENKYL